MTDFQRLATTWHGTKLSYEGHSLMGFYSMLREVRRKEEIGKNRHHEEQRGRKEDADEKGGRQGKVESEEKGKEKPKNVIVGK